MAENNSVYSGGEPAPSVTSISDTTLKEFGDALSAFCQNFGHLAVGNPDVSQRDNVDYLRSLVNPHVNSDNPASVAGSSPLTPLGIETFEELGRLEEMLQSYRSICQSGGRGELLRTAWQMRKMFESFDRCLRTLVTQDSIWDGVVFYVSPTDLPGFAKVFTGSVSLGLEELLESKDEDAAIFGPIFARKILSCFDWSDHNPEVLAGLLELAESVQKSDCLRELAWSEMTEVSKVSKVSKALDLSLDWIRKIKNYKKGRRAQNMVQGLPRGRHMLSEGPTSEAVLEELSRKMKDVMSFETLYEVYHKKGTKHRDILSQVLRDLASLPDSLGSFNDVYYFHFPGEEEFVRRDDAGFELDTCQVRAALTSLLSRTDRCMDESCAAIVRLGSIMRVDNPSDRVERARRLEIPEAVAVAPLDILKAVQTKCGPDPKVVHILKTYPKLLTYT
ncbi:hypothetical protein M231_03964 [Tremella mesenterica]|uniref:Uncharacterized protein n=1 Tax=Tremella mesenterica TaxID=5217 RepID=A0A4Q1BLV7_TREME|nr:hypothetical protein M231_03964 [Tremella mesenterica]